MLVAAAMGAVAFQKDLGVVHSMAHPLSTVCGMHHGLANAIHLPYGMEFNSKGMEDKFRRMAQALELENLTSKSVIGYLHALNEKLGIPKQLRAIGVKEEHLSKLADLAIADFAHPNNPRPVTREDFMALYSKAL